MKRKATCCWNCQHRKSCPERQFENQFALKYPCDCMVHGGRCCNGGDGCGKCAKFKRKEKKA